MTETYFPPPTQTVIPSHSLFATTQLPASSTLELAPTAEPVEEEPYTIKCICNFSDDDGHTIYCDTCDTWQHIDCFYPNNREEALRAEFAHSCAECKPRPLDRERALERTRGLQNNPLEDTAQDKKARRPPARSHKKKAKPVDLQLNGNQPVNEYGKHATSNDHQPPAAKKVKTSHKPSQSLGAVTPKRSPYPSNINSRPSQNQPPSPDATPPNLPDDFEIHNYSPAFYSLYNAREVEVVHNNSFASLAISNAMSLWLREPERMKLETGRTYLEVFEDFFLHSQPTMPQLLVGESRSSPLNGNILRWRFLTTETPVDKDTPLMELNGEVGFQKDYCADPENLWADFSSPLPLVFFHPSLPLYIDTRKEGSEARYVRRSCKPNALLGTSLSRESQYHFWLVSDRVIASREQITLPWDFRLPKKIEARWLHLLGLGDSDCHGQTESDMNDAEYKMITDWIHHVLSEYGGCACNLGRDCAFARFHRHYLYWKSQARLGNHKRKARRPKAITTASPTSTGHATNSRAASEGHDGPVDDGLEQDARSISDSRSKPPSRDLTPLRQGTFDQLGILTGPTDRDKRKVAMLEDTFRRMEQQPPRVKKKRASDGTATSNSHSRHKSSKPMASVTANGGGHFTDAATYRSKSGSPVSAASPTARHHDMGTSRIALASSRSSGKPRPVYCDVAVQTDPVEGEWFSEPCRTPKPTRRIISLSQRLLRNRLQHKMEDGQWAVRKAKALPEPQYTDTHVPQGGERHFSQDRDLDQDLHPDRDPLPTESVIMDLVFADPVSSDPMSTDPVSVDPVPPDLMSAVSDPVITLEAPVSQPTPEDSRVCDLPSVPPTALTTGDITLRELRSVSPFTVLTAPNGAGSPGPLAGPQPKPRTGDLRVQMPPVPGFRQPNPSLPTATTPLSATSSHSPLLSANGSFSSPFQPGAGHGLVSAPSPVKKKLSLSDYTKSRLNKAAVKLPAIAIGAGKMLAGADDGRPLLVGETVTESPTEKVR